MVIVNDKQQFRLLDFEMTMLLRQQKLQICMQIILKECQQNGFYHGYVLHM